MSPLDIYCGTSVHDDLVTILDYYRSIENDFDEFASVFRIHCPENCGHCCEHFIPDITRLEALAIAYTLVDERNEGISFLDGWAESHECCPLYDMETHRCKAYAVRPVICRTFFSAASRTRHGLSFRGCSRAGIEEDLDEKTLLAGGIDIPVMGDYGEKVDTMQVECTRMLLDDAVLSAASRLSLTRFLASGNGEGEDRAG